MTREEAIKILRDVHDKALFSVRNALETLIPELSESDDERIRKALVEVASEVAQERFFINRGTTLKDVLAYLEKQKDCILVPKSHLDPVGEPGVDGMKILEKQKEQIPMNNPKWNELTWKDINELEEIINHVHYEFRNGISAEGFGKEVLEQFRNMKEDAEVDACEQKPSMIQWKGDNLKEVIDFTGKSPMFDKWFKSFEEYEEYVHLHGNIFKLFNEDGAHYEVPVGAWIVKTPDGCNVASKAIFRQKPSIFPPGLGEVHWNPISSVQQKPADDKSFGEWIDGWYNEHHRDGYITMDERGFKNFCRGIKNMYAGQKPSEWSDEEFEHTVGYLVQDIVANEHMPEGEKKPTRFFVEKYIKKLHPKNTIEWSEDDKKRIEQLIYDTEHIRAEYEERKKELGENFNDNLIKDCDEQIAWLKAILLNIKKKNEDVAKPCSNEWSEEDKKTLNAIISVLMEIKSQPLKRLEDLDGYIHFLKSLRPSWKPSEEQIYSLGTVVNGMGESASGVSKNLRDLYEQLKKL